MIFYVAVCASFLMASATTTSTEMPALLRRGRDHGLRISIPPNFDIVSGPGAPIIGRSAGSVFTFETIAAAIPSGGSKKRDRTEYEASGPDG